MLHRLKTFPLVTNLKSKLINFLVVILILFTILFNSFTQVIAQSDSSDVQYQIQPGDTLGSIALEFGISLDSLVLANNIINPDSISPGQIIVIPGLTGIDGVLTPLTIGLDESFNSLTRQFSFISDATLKLNRITSIDEIYVGTRLLIPIPAEFVSPQMIAVNDDLSLFQTAIYLDTSIDQIVLANNLNNYLQLFPDDSVFLPSNANDLVYSKNHIQEDVTLLPLPLVQGATSTITVVSDSIADVTGSLDGHELHFYNLDSPEHFFALQGINALAKPGLSKFHLSILNKNGKVKIFEYNVLLVEGNFPVDSPIIVDPLTIDPQTTKPENDFVNELVTHKTNEKLWSGIFQSPAFYQEYTSLFGSRRTYNDDPTITFHGGLDFGGGETLPIIAPADGVVVFSGFLPIRGNATFIDHGLGVYSGFFHQSLLLVSKGDHVINGQKIGEVGNTGRVGNANDYPGAGAHLHWEIWVSGVQVNPLDWLSIEYP